MAFDFGSAALIDPLTFSRLVYQSDDGSAGMSDAEKANVEFLVQSASRQITDYLGRDIKSATFSEVWDGQAADMIIPRQYPITAVSEVRFSANADFTQGTVLGTGEYGFDEESVFLLFNRTPFGRRCVRVIYTAGFVTVPQSIQIATVIQFQMLNKAVSPGSKGTGPSDLGMESISKMGETARKDTSLRKNGLASEAVGLIEPFRRLDAPLSIMFSRVS
jgi:hypothetical protein